MLQCQEVLCLNWAGKLFSMVPWVETTPDGNMMWVHSKSMLNVSATSGDLNLGWPLHLAMIGACWNSLSTSRSIVMSSPLLCSSLVTDYFLSTNQANCSSKLMYLMAFNIYIGMHIHKLQQAKQIIKCC
jgi:hypothetical protein